MPPRPRFEKTLVGVFEGQGGHVIMIPREGGLVHDIGKMRKKIGKDIFGRFIFEFG